MKILLVCLLLCLFSACSNVRFRSESNLPITFAGKPREQKEITLTIKKDFLLWGLAPSYQTIYLDKEVEDAGHGSLSKAIIYEKRVSQDVLLSIITLGFYMPKTYIVTGFTEK